MTFLHRLNYPGKGDSVDVNFGDVPDSDLGDVVIEDEA
jgi:hypothetical protein